MQYVDIRRRDGLARQGTVHFADGSDLSFPSALETDRFFPSLLYQKFTNVPLCADPEFVTAYFHAGDEQPFSVHPRSEEAISNGSCVMVSNWHTAFTNPRNYVEWLVALKSRIPLDTVWYSPAAALPSTVALLIYTGFDLFDYRGVDLMTARHLFCTVEGEYPEGWLNQGICTCDGCRQNNLFHHNRGALQREIALATRFIGLSQLRELLEARCRMKTSHVAILRHLDNHYAFFERRIPIARANGILATSGDSLHRPEVIRFAERVIERYRPPQGDIAVLLPCSAKKPYSFSLSHHKFRNAIRGRAHELIITSPLGLVPRELEGVYPAAHYDVPVTGYWDREELAWVGGVIQRFFKKNRYHRIIAHVDGGARKAVEEGFSSLGIEPEYTCRGTPTSPQSLEALDTTLGDAPVLHPASLIRGILSWQFGIDLDTQGLTLRKRVNETIVMRGKEQLFTISSSTGLGIPTLDGWNLIAGGYRVIIDNFIPRGDILAAGVIAADEQIREGDEVLVCGREVQATGKAAMGADEMISSRRGVAVRVRKRLKSSPGT